MSQRFIILPFDHRRSFAKDLLGIDGVPDISQRREITNLKEMVFEAFLKTVQKYNKNDFGILVDEEYGLDILKKSQHLGIKVAAPVEKSGGTGFEFEYGDEDFDKHIHSIKPDFVKALVRYNPENIEINKEQLKKLQILSEYCVRFGYKLLFELLVPATEYDLKVEGSKEVYDRQLRYLKTIQAIKEIVPHVRVDLWKLEGFEGSQWDNIVRSVNPGAKIIVLGRGAGIEQVERWLISAAKYPEIIGFAVGRTVFHEPLASYTRHEIDRNACINLISQNFTEFVEVWYKSKHID